MQTARSKTRAAAAEESKRYCKVGLADCGSDLGLDIIGRECEKAKLRFFALLFITRFKKIHLRNDVLCCTCPEKLLGA